MAKRESIQFTMLQTALDGITNDNTAKAYKKDIKDFALWARSEGYKSVDEIKQAGVKKVVQQYRDEALLSHTNSPSTEHRKIAAVCKGLGITRPRGAKEDGWDDRIITSKRTADKIVRGRIIDANKQGKLEQNQDKFKRLVQLQSVLGIRRSELGRLRGRDLIRDESGCLCVRVERGKGGKKQLQRILSGDIETVRSVFAGIEPEKKVFSAKEMQNHLNLHGLRAAQAQKAYSFYARVVENPEEKKELIRQLTARFVAAHDSYHGRKAFFVELKRCETNPIYSLRGKNREKALSLGLSTSYDRLSLLAVSVFHLSHWRLDVTVVNYMIQ